MAITRLALLMTVTLVLLPGAEGQHSDFRQQRRAAFRMQLGRLRDMHKQLNAKVNALEGKLQTINNNLISTISVAEGRLQTKENNLQSAVNALQGSVQAMSSKIALLDQIVYFMATFAAPSLTVGGGTVVFNKVLMNTGSAYNPTTGVFTAPRRGLYVFLVQTFTNGKGNPNWDLYVNGQMVLRSESMSVSSTSNEYVYPLTLQTGDKVSVYSRNPLSSWGTIHSFFGGWLIRAF
ncbi:hypothetical protein C0Q70_17370 [Pomacea canaliculata]|uniref:C1q domain-containing protein n=1 Tax=Pomacea canaliculata TaxID=400727 RepID=A0A2T7NK76_POMCA|nr:uncharacterized protein LOC112576122 [Pomacea canaliculata]PVD21572.1 hypothetical protein C0Q70_17370 [Pomacea canaliculata]